jgi:putative ABC transport system ATP-binding protein
MAILQVNNLSKTYGKGDTVVTALGGVSFNVEKGEFVAIVGASGSGKSTLMHLLGGVDRPTAGSVVIDGNEIHKSNESALAIFRRRNIGIIYQFYNLIPTLTAEENIMLPRLLDNRKPDKSKLQNILETIGLADRAKHLPSELSGGQQQRVSVGRALINDPAIILADEPTGNLDSKTSREIIDLLKLSNKRFNQTLLIITHDENVALSADRVITISDGQILRDEVVRQ